MKILELFSGYGTASFALKRLGIDYEIVGYSDIDRYANQCFKQNHGGKELGDVKTINPYDLEDFDLLTGGFPCQSFSVAGKGLGEADPRGTLFYEIIRIAEVKKPKYMLLENVKGLTNKPHKQTFDKILSELDRIGYNVYWKVLNSKDYGIPQSRARVWFVCFRKDIEHKFEWPQPTELKIFIKDILEDEVDKKYYLSEKLQERFAKYLKNRVVNLQPKQEKGIVITGLQKHQSIKTDGISNALPSAMGMGGGHNPIVYDFHRKGTKSQYDTNMSIPEIGEAHRIYGVNGISPPIKQSGINIKDNIAGGNNVLSVAISNSSPRECGFQEEISPTLLSRDYKDPKIVINNYILRKLTPKECFRLMGFLNDEINFNYTEKRYFYKDKGNIRLWKQQSAKSNAVIEQPTHTNMEITALCTTKDLNELELGKNKEEILRKIENVCIAIERLEKVDVRECVINITKCSDYTEMLYTLIKRKIELNEMDMFVELEEGRGIKSLWKISLEENLSEEKSFIISILINWIIQKKIYSYVKTESTIIANIMNYNLLPQNFLNLELSSLRMDTTKKLSDTALYKLAGNGQDVNMVSLIFKQMFKEEWDNRYNIGKENEE